MEFKPFAKIPRLSRDCVITEKIDGTNASITITEDGQFLTASRNRWITPEDDNFGFSKWAHENKEELMKLGIGTHFGEWWGRGIQIGYGLEERKFSLFFPKGELPSCVGVVPTLFKGEFTTENVQACMDMLMKNGSYAAPGYMEPEGIVVYHTASGQRYKKTVRDDGIPKTLADKIHKEQQQK